MDPNTPLRPNPAKRHRNQDENAPLANTPKPPTTPHSTTSTTPVTTATPAYCQPLKKIWANGHVKVPPKPPPYSPYTPLKLSGKYQNQQTESFAFPVIYKLHPKPALTALQWNKLAREHGLIKNKEYLRDFQVEGANVVTGRSQDICVVAPTGAGKPLLWMLPLLVQSFGISLVIVPYMCLGFQGEKRYGSC
ncbi:hypothetical protein BJ165DRAFT_1409821 [Panaeolus papilionaceus]|nr:hypothetical protein BJ165DRAFT_1409821 [Panaeolus papilionaceus]